MCMRLQQQKVSAERANHLRSEKSKNGQKSHHQSIQLKVFPIVNSPLLDHPEIQNIFFSTHLI